MVSTIWRVISSKKFWNCYNIILAVSLPCINRCMQEISFWSFSKCYCKLEWILRINWIFKFFPALYYYCQNSVNPWNVINFDKWQDNFVRPDGQPATREHLLMALADVSSILIRASYHTDMADSSIRDISLDIASKSHICIILLVTLWVSSYL